MPFSDLQRHQAYMWYMDLHAEKNIYTHKINKSFCKTTTTTIRSLSFFPWLSLNSWAKMLFFPRPSGWQTLQNVPPCPAVDISTLKDAYIIEWESRLKNLIHKFSSGIMYNYFCSFLVFWFCFNLYKDLSNCSVQIKNNFKMKCQTVFREIWSLVKIIPGSER